jgi:uncharacterized protein YeaO (DUF488 family)
MSALQRKIGLKRVYDMPDESDGTRVLVDRLWPRGLTKAEARVDFWLRDLAPSNELRKWFHAHSDQWAEFRRKYLQELRSPDAAGALAKLADLLSSNGHVTFLFASKDTERNNAVVLKEVMEGSKKPPHTTQPASAQARARKSRPRR